MTFSSVATRYGGGTITTPGTSGPTGPTGPTGPAGSNGTGTGSARFTTVVLLATNTTLTAGQAGSLFIFNTPSIVTTLPARSTMVLGDRLFFSCDRLTTGNVTLNAAGSDIFYVGSNGNTVNTIGLYQGDSFELIAGPGNSWDASVQPLSALFGTTEQLVIGTGFTGGTKIPVGEAGSDVYETPTTLKTWLLANGVASGSGAAGPTGPTGAVGATGPAGSGGTGGTVTNIETTYSISGAISPLDDIAYCTYASTASMTLANGAAGGHVIYIKRWSTGVVNLTANIDGVANTTLTMQDAAMTKECIGLRMSLTKATWVLI